MLLRCLVQQYEPATRKPVLKGRGGERKHCHGPLQQRGDRGCQLEVVGERPDPVHTPVLDPRLIKGLPGRTQEGGQCIYVSEYGPDRNPSQENNRSRVLVLPFSSKNKDSQLFVTFTT